MLYILFLIAVIFPYFACCSNTDNKPLEEVTNQAHNFSTEVYTPTISDKRKRIVYTLQAEEVVVSLNNTLPTQTAVPLNLKGKVSREDIHKLRNIQYNKISLYRAYSQEDLTCLLDDYFIIDPGTFNPQVQDLSLKVCGLSDEHIKEIGRFSRLQRLNLHSNLITEKGVDVLLALSQLNILDLGNNYINDPSVKKLLANLTNLTSLNISNNKNVTDCSLEFFKLNTTLRELNLKITSITPEAFNTFKTQFTHLTKLEYFPRVDSAND